MTLQANMFPQPYSYIGSHASGPYVIDASGKHYRDLNALVREHAASHAHIELRNVCGQRYIGTNMGKNRATIHVYGTPGNDLGTFMNGSEVVVYGNAQDGVGNTMNAGQVVVHGNAGDVAGMSMRGGKVFVRGNVGYRCALHMKESAADAPTVVVGGTCQDFFAEYMAGGVAVLLGLNLPEPGLQPGNYLGTGMHGGVIFLRGSIDPTRLGKEVGVNELTSADWQTLTPLLEEFSGLFQVSMDEIMSRPFLKLFAKNKRPYGSLYAY